MGANWNQRASRRFAALAASATIMGAALGAPTRAATPWAVLAARLSPAVYAIDVGAGVPLNLAASQPQWAGTGFQLAVGHRLLEYTACHMVCYDVPAHTDLLGAVPQRWDVWAQVDIAPLGQPDASLSYRAFAPQGTWIFPNSDVAFSTNIPHVHSPVITYGPAVDAIPGALWLGNYATLRPGQTLMVLGNPGGTWTGAGPTRSMFTYLGVRRNFFIHYGEPFPNHRVPEVLAMRGPAIQGMSGGPVIDQQGGVVGVFVALRPGYGYAIPLYPSDGYPVGGLGLVPQGRDG